LLEVAPLAVPAAGERYARRIRTNEAARLFAERARAVRVNFALTDEIAEAVAEICRRLDGLPIALELAAARLQTLSLTELARGLDERFGLLTNGGRTARPRERTLRGMVDWSWELLGERERVLLRRLAVFAGGWAREAATAVCADDGQAADQVGAALNLLVERSLVVRDDWRGQTRYRLLDTLRAYAGERLEDAGETAALRRRHQDWYLDRLEASFDEIAADQLGWLAWMDAELDNVRAALDWCRAEPGTAERALRASSGLWAFCDIRGHADESRRRFDELLSLLPSGSSSSGRLLGLVFLGHVLASQGDLARAEPLLQEALSLASEVHDPTASFWSGMMELQWRMLFDATSAPAFARAQLAANRRCPVPLGEALLLWYLGAVLLATGELDEAERTLQMAAVSTTAELVHGHVADSRGRAAYRRGNLTAARSFFREALVDLARLRSVRACALTVEHLASVAGRLGSWERAARLLGATEMLHELASMVPIVPWQLDVEEITAACRDALGEKAFATAFTAGQTMSFERAIQYALEPDGPREQGRRGAGPHPLTPREREIARLVAEGLSNRRIADALVVSEKTVETHLSHILTKLELASRTRLAIWVSEQGAHGTAGLGPI
jgi:DNA-binding CsgD family transcriptional regulator/tetratricopeptide (TPR) repeat protein